MFVFGVFLQMSDQFFDFFGEQGNLIFSGTSVGVVSFEGLGGLFFLLGGQCHGVENCPTGKFRIGKRKIIINNNFRLAQENDFGKSGRIKMYSVGQINFQKRKPNSFARRLFACGWVEAPINISFHPIFSNKKA